MGEAGQEEEAMWWQREAGAERSCHQKLRSTWQWKRQEGSSHRACRRLQECQCPEAITLSCSLTDLGGGRGLNESRAHRASPQVSCS